MYHILYYTCTVVYIYNICIIWFVATGDHDVCSNNNNNILYIPLLCIIKEIIYRIDPGGHLHAQGPGRTLTLTHTRTLANTSTLHVH